MKTRTAVMTALLLNTWIIACSATALAPSKATDDSVCDLSPTTTALLGRQTFISASRSADEQAMGYRRLAAVFVADHCGSGQTLILHSQDSDEIDARYLNALAVGLCKASDVQRTETSSSARLSDDKVVGYELRCHISKFEAFRKQLQSEAATEPTASLIARLRAMPASTGSPPPNSKETTAPQASHQDCSKPNLSATTVGGGGCR